MNYENMTRRRVLCFGDSNTYGYDPARDGRYGDDERYPMVLQDLLGVISPGLKKTSSLPANLLATALCVLAAGAWSRRGCPGAPPCLTTLLQKV